MGWLFEYANNVPGTESEADILKRRPKPTDHYMMMQFAYTCASSITLGSSLAIHGHLTDECGCLGEVECIMAPLQRCQPARKCQYHVVKHLSIQDKLFQSNLVLQL
jgi:hypothetical protein